MEKKLLFVLNPHAGKAQIKNKLLDIVDLFVKNSYEVTVYPTQSYMDALKITKEKGDLYDLIVCSGGDGTLNEVVSGIMQCQKKLTVGYIPAGSTNDFANSLNLSKHMLEAAEAVVGGETYACDIGRFNEDYFVYIAAFGLFTDVAYETKQEMKNILGHMAYILEGVKSLFSIHSYWMDIDCNGEKIEAEFIFGMVTNSVSVGGFKNLTGKNVELDDGLFEVTLVKKPESPLELQEIIASLLKAEADEKYVWTFKADKISFHAKESVPWTLDGEFGGEHEEVVVINDKQAFNILIGSPKGDEEEDDAFY